MFVAGVCGRGREVKVRGEDAPGETQAFSKLGHSTACGVGPVRLIKHFICWALTTGKVLSLVTGPMPFLKSSEQTCKLGISSRAVVPNLFGNRDWFQKRGLGMVWVDSRAFHWLCTLFLLLLHQLHLRWSGIRSQRSGNLSSVGWGKWFLRIPE